MSLTKLAEKVGAFRDRMSKWTMLPLLTLIYGVGELGHFLIGVVTRSASQDIGYGDMSCLPKLLKEDLPENLTLPSHYCKKFESLDNCFAARVENFTDYQLCEWNNDGFGTDYQILAAAAFMICFCIMGIVWGLLADKYNRVYLLTLSTVVYSAAICGTAFSTEYWHLVIFRIILAAGDAATPPLAAAMISDVFPPSKRALAMAVFSWGIYYGFGGSFAIGTYVQDKNIFDQPWRTSYLVSGLPGFVLAAVFLLTVTEPRNNKAKKSEENPTVIELDEKGDAEKKEDTPQEEEDNTPTWKILLNLVKRPEILLLIVASCIRHSAGYCWGYNSELYFEDYYPEFDANWWLFGISISGGMIGCIVGGVVSDKLVNRLGLSSRVLVLAATQLLSFPFSLGVMFAEPPYSFIPLFIGIITSETWFGVVFATLVELVPPKVRSTFMGISLFIINLAGGCLPMLVEPLRKATNFHTAVTIQYPGALLISSVLFFVCWIILRKR